MYHVRAVDTRCLQDLLDEAYLPLMSAALVQTQAPRTAAGIVREVFLNAVDSPTTNWTPVRLFMEMLQSTFHTLMHKSETPMLADELMRNSALLSVEHYVPPVSFLPNAITKLRQSNDVVGKMPSDNWLLYPLLQEDPDRYKQATKAGLLCWLSNIKSDAFTVALLADWLDYHPMKPNAKIVLGEISYLTGIDPERVHSTWELQHDEWILCFTSEGPALLEAMGIWLESINLSQENFIRDYLGALTYSDVSASGDGI
ncbi:MAG: hypothetical protein FWE76_07105 [Symbiobacteriaceae bacterium]|nr:hypothetical protein [Symbiobacteriaceae bacterium]